MRLSFLTSQLFLADTFEENHRDLVTEAEPVAKKRKSQSRDSMDPFLLEYLKEKRIRQDESERRKQARHADQMEIEKQKLELFRKLIDKM